MRTHSQAMMATRMRSTILFEHKIIFTGPVGAGKTTLIKAFSGSEPVLTEVRASDEVSQLKESTTVAMDYGSVILDEETKVHLYGTPGQKRFDFMWDILSRGSMGLAILINAKAPKPLDDLRFYLDAFKGLIVDQDLPVVVGINQVNKDQPEPSRAEFKAVAEEFRLGIPVLMIDAREEKDVRRMVMTLLFS